QRLWIFLMLGAAASALLAGGLVMMKSRGEALPAAEGSQTLRAIIRWIRDPVWVGGLGLETAGYALYVIALADAPVSLLAVAMQGGIALFVVFAEVFLGERAQGREWLGIGGILVSMVLLALSLPGGAAQSPARIPALVILTLGLIVAAAFPGASVKLRSSGAASAIASGIAFGLASLYTK